MDNSSEVKKFFQYLPEIIKFYKLKNEGLARLIFVLVLFCQLLGDYIQYKVMNLMDNLDVLYTVLFTGQIPAEFEQTSEYNLHLLLLVLGITLLVKLISNLLYSVYMYSYILELRGKNTGYKSSFSGAFKHIGRLIIYNITFGLMVLLGSTFFILPGLIAYVLFVFGYCYIMDLKLTVPDAMTASNEITRGKKQQIINVFLGYLLLFKLPVLLFFTGSSLGIEFISSFFTAITGLILQRLICQLYMDLEYRRHVKN